MSVMIKTKVLTTKNKLKPKTIGTKNETSSPNAAPMASAANTTSGFFAAASNNTGKKLPVTKDAGANNNRLAQTGRSLCKNSSSNMVIPAIN